MSTAQKNNLSRHNYSGFLLINKPSSFASTYAKASADKKATEDRPGPTSHDIIDELRRITGIRQIGHAGTLDPFASGLLLVGLGEATKLLRHYVGLDKKYEATLKLGAESDTYDRTGKIIENGKWKMENGKITKEKINKILKSFIGRQKQIPPMYSAKKVNGRKLYQLARAGQEIQRKPIEIEIYNLELSSIFYPLLSIFCHVSSGTYIRALGHDIGQKLGCGAYLKELERTAIGEFKLEDAIGHDIIIKDNWQQYLIPIKTVLVTGTFDGLHAGHRNYFQQARQFGQRLIAIVSRGTTVQKTKAQRPKFSEKERVRFVKNCPEIDRVYLGAEKGIYDFAAALKPDVIALGYDQQAYTANLEEEMKKRGLNVQIIRLKPYQPDKYKSSIINRQI